MRSKAHAIKKNRKIPIPHNAMLYRRRDEIENIFDRLKDWRRIHTRCDRYARIVMSVICIAETIIFSIKK